LHGLHRHGTKRTKVHAALVVHQRILLDLLLVDVFLVLVLLAALVDVHQAVRVLYALHPHRLVPVAQPGRHGVALAAHDGPYVGPPVGLALHAERGVERYPEARVDEVAEAAARDERLGPLGDGALGARRQPLDGLAAGDELEQQDAEAVDVAGAGDLAPTWRTPARGSPACP
jgi:hypothetical protein